MLNMLVDRLRTRTCLKRALAFPDYKRTRSRRPRRGYVTDDYSTVNLSNADKNDFSNENCDAKQSINLNDHFVLDHLYMFISAQLEIKSDSENVH